MFLINEQPFSLNALRALAVRTEIFIVNNFNKPDKHVGSWDVMRASYYLTHRCRTSGSGEMRCGVAGCIVMKYADGERGGTPGGSSMSILGKVGGFWNFQILPYTLTASIIVLDKCSACIFFTQPYLRKGREVHKVAFLFQLLSSLGFCVY